jgi:hypothetical protein
MVKAAGEGAAKAILDSQNQKKAETKLEDQPPALPAKDQRKMEILARMEELYPDSFEYKGIAKRYQESMRKLVEYAEKWKKENPGEKFDEDGPEHEDFYRQNAVDWEDDHYVEAVADLRAESRAAKLVDKRMEKIDGDVEELRRTERAKELAPQVESFAEGWMTRMLEGLSEDPDMKEVVLAITGDDGTISKEKLSGLSGTIAGDVIVEHFGKRILEPMTAALFKLYQGLERYNPQNQTHAWLNRFLVENERAMMSLPESNRVNRAGQKFLPSAQYAKLVKESPSEVENYWTFNEVDLGKVLTDQVRRDAAVAYREESSKHERWQNSRNNSPGKPTEQPAKQDELDGDGFGDDGKPSSPSLGVSPKSAIKAAKGRSSDEESASAFIGKFIG